MRCCLIYILVFINSLSWAQTSHVRWASKTKSITACEYELVFTADIDPHWHIYSVTQKHPDGPNATSFTFVPSPAYTLLGPIKESKPKMELDNVFGMRVAFHEHQAVFTQRIKVLSVKPFTINGQFEAQACDSVQCTFPPADAFTFTIGASECGAAAERDTAATSNENVQDNNPPITHTGSTISPSIYQADETDLSKLNWLEIFLAGLIGGFAALFTPCVFPMIPMNVSYFTKHSKNRRQGMQNALLYSLFLISIYVILGLSITLIFGAGALHTLSTNVWFNLGFFLLLLIFAFSFLGAFELVLPSTWVNRMDAKAEKKGHSGIFFMAFTLALVSFSCTGPIIGTLLVQAAAGGGISGPFWGMLGFSSALAIPFGLFAAFPGWLNALPKSGGWLNAVKVVLGFLELALALKFASNADLVVQAGILTRELFIVLWLAIFLLQGLYLLGVFKTAHDTAVNHLSVFRLMMAVITFGMVFYLLPGLWGAPLKLLSGVLPPAEYSEAPHGFGPTETSVIKNTDDAYSTYIERNKHGILYFKNDYARALAYAKKQHKPLLVDFTGHACANCRKTEDYVWPDPQVTRLLNDNYVLVSLYVDDKRPLDPSEYDTVTWYGKTRIIRDIGDKFKYMEETRYGQSAQPLYVILNHAEEPLLPVRGYNADIAGYIKWLQAGIAAFKNSNVKP